MLWATGIIKALFAAAGIAVPGIGPKTITVLAALMIVGGFGFVCYMKGADGKQAALAEQKLEYVVKLQQERESNAEELRRARALGAAEPPIATDRAKRMRQCGESPTCRERGAGKK